MAKIIIVEDDKTIAEIYKQKLEEGGHTVEVAEDVSAVAAITVAKPNLVILDIIMPKINGLDILREIKANAQTASIPVLLLTNVAEDASVAKGLEYGAYGYLLKSETTPDQILPRVNRTLEETSPPTP